MRLTMIAAAVVTTCLISQNIAAADDVPITVVKTTSLQPGNFVRQEDAAGNSSFVQSRQYAPVLRLTVRVDKITVIGMTGNRGNCLLQPQISLPAGLVFGQTLEVHLGCNALELVVETDQGQLAYTWDQ